MRINVFEWNGLTGLYEHPDGRIITPALMDAVATGYIDNQQELVSEDNFDAEIVLEEDLKVCGRIYNDKKKRWPDGTPIFPTAIQFFRTRNTAYKVVEEK